MGKITLEDKLEAIQKLRPIDDIFFAVLAANKKVCTEILRTILDDKELVVEDVITQASIRNIYARSVTLDALCTLGSGRKCNIEVQRSDNDDHLRRVRFNASSITVKESNPGEHFTDVIELYIVYISEFDIFRGGLTTYHVNKTVRENGQLIDDGLHEIYVNAAVNDGSIIAELMECFRQSDVNNSQFPELSAEVNRLKNTEGGLSSMCKVMEELFEDERKQYEAEIAKVKAQKEAEIEKVTAQKDAEIARLKAALAAR